MKEAKRNALLTELATAQRHVMELKAQLACSIGAAFDAVPKASKFHGSGVIVTVTALGGAVVVPPVVIRDGISAATVDALQNDLRRSFELATLVNPAMARPVGQS
jgi:hypothetical protein